MADNHPAQAQQRQGRGIPAWVWILVGVVVLLGLPAAACGAFGFSLALAARQPARTVTPGSSVGVITVEGPIMAGESVALGAAAAGSDTIIELIERANENSNIEAIVLRVNSPGGDVVASDEIHHAVTLVDKPVVVSMGSMAASGGYYISAPADYIYATPYTLTGSIGVISQFFNAEELLDELGVEVTVITAGEVKDFGSFTRDMTEEEREYWQSLISTSHEGFIERVAAGRDLTVEEVREVADGRIILGVDAVELGLVDEVGYMEDAIARAGELGGISGEPNVVELEPSTGFLESLYGFQMQGRTEVLDMLLQQFAPPSFEFRYLSP